MARLLSKSVAVVSAVVLCNASRLARLLLIPVAVAVIVATAVATIVATIGASAVASTGPISVSLSYLLRSKNSSSGMSRLAKYARYLLISRAEAIAIAVAIAVVIASDSASLSIGASAVAVVRSVSLSSGSLYC